MLVESQGIKIKTVQLFDNRFPIIHRSFVIDKNISLNFTQKSSSVTKTERVSNLKIISVVVLNSQ
jgi:hypothetical protein